MLSIGDQVGTFEILESIGAGGMGVLFRARDSKLGRDVAIKLLTEEFVGRSDHLARFKQEARSASALNHPNIITVYEIGEHEGRPFIAMELIEGKTLRTLIAEGALTMRKTLQLALQIAQGLAAAHGKGIIHRDLKPDNVMITKDGFVKILDFGLAKLASPPVLEDASTAEVAIATHPGAIMGTVGYMSPEQVRGQSLDFRSDQFSFGAILYEMVTGRRAFKRGTPFDTLAAVIHDNPEGISQVNPRVPDSIRRVVQRCLEKESERRYASTADLVVEMEAAKDEVTHSHSLELKTQGVPGVRWRQIAAVAVAAVAISIAGVVIFREREQAPTVPAGVRFEVPGETVQLTVIPFRDLTGKPSGQLIGDGFAETVSARLSAGRNIQVISTAALAVTHESDPREVAKKSGANLIVRGTLQQAGDQIRVTWTLLESSGVQRAAGDVDGRVIDLFGMQDRVAESILVAIDRNLPTKVAQQEPSTEADRYLEALGHLRRGDDVASVDAAISILGALQPTARVKAALARAYVAKFQASSDLEWATRALRAADEAEHLDPSLQEVLLIRGYAFLLESRFDMAIKAYTAALEQKPDSFEALIGLGRSEHGAGHLDLAERHLRRAIDLRPDFWGGYNDLGALFLIHGRYDEAIHSFEKALQLTPDNTEILNNLGAALQQKGQYPEAVAAYGRSLEIRPNANALSNLGSCQFFLGQYDEAVRSFERATALSPSSGLLWMNLGDAYRWSTQEKDKAKKAYLRAIDAMTRNLTLRPRDPMTHWMLAVCHAKSGNREDALSHLDLALELAPTDPFTLYQAAVVTEITGDRVSATEYLRKAIAVGYSLEEARRDPELSAISKKPEFAIVHGRG